eukprot:3224315-Ditylum_brightwellii.AAC.1
MELEGQSHNPSPRLGLLWAVICVFLVEATSQGNAPYVEEDPNFLPEGPPDVGFVSMHYYSLERRKRGGRAPGRYRVRLRKTQRCRWRRGLINLLQ